MSTKRRAKCAPGWWWRGPGTLAMLAVTVVPICAAGGVLVCVSDLIGKLR